MTEPSAFEHEITVESWGHRVAVKCSLCTRPGEPGTALLIAETVNGLTIPEITGVVSAHFVQMNEALLAFVQMNEALLAKNAARREKEDAFRANFDGGPDWDPEAPGRDYESRGGQ